MTKVIMEPDLEELATLWTPARRLEAARKMERWARQLRLSAKIMELNGVKKPRKEIKWLPLKKAILN